MAGSRRQLLLEHVQPGMVLSDDLLDHSGRRLLIQGSVLTESVLASLQKHHISAVPVLHDGEDQKPEPDPALQLQRLEKLFRKPDDPAEDANAILRQYILEYRLGDTT